MADKIVKIDGFEVQGSDKPRIRDVDLGERLGYDRPRDIRQLIERLSKDGEIAEVQTRGTVTRVARKGRGQVEIASTEYWLTREQALLVCMRSDAKSAASVRSVMVGVLLRVFDLAGEQLSWAETPFIRYMLTPPGQKEAWEGTISENLVRHFCRVWGVKWEGGRHRRFLGRIQQLIYQELLGPAYRVMKERVPKPRHGDNLSQQIQRGEPKETLKTAWHDIETLLEISENRDDFWAKFDRKFKGRMLQLTLIRELAS